jgi:hypothetical protein
MSQSFSQTSLSWPQPVVILLSSPHFPNVCWIQTYTFWWSTLTSSGMANTRAMMNSRLSWRDISRASYLVNRKFMDMYAFHGYKVLHFFPHLRTDLVTLEQHNATLFGSLDDNRNLKMPVMTRTLHLPKPYNPSPHRIQQRSQDS